MCIVSNIKWDLFSQNEWQVARNKRRCKPQNLFRKKVKYLQFWTILVLNQLAALHENLITWTCRKVPQASIWSDVQCLACRQMGVFVLGVVRYVIGFLFSICLLQKPVTDVAKWECALSNIGFIYINDVVSKKGSWTS